MHRSHMSLFSPPPPTQSTHLPPQWSLASREQLKQSGYYTAYMLCYVNQIYHSISTASDRSSRLLITIYLLPSALFHLPFFSFIRSKVSRCFFFPTDHFTFQCQTFSSEGISISPLFPLDHQQQYKSYSFFHKRLAHTNFASCPHPAPPRDSSVPTPPCCFSTFASLKMFNKELNKSHLTSFCCLICPLIYVNCTSANNAEL